MGRSSNDKNNKKKNARILCISDTHVPYHHPDTWDFLDAVRKKYKPTRVVHLGDEVDLHAISDHSHDPDLDSPGTELQQTRREIQPLFDLFPQVDVLESNHGSRVYRAAVKFGLSREYFRTYSEILDAPPGWVWHDSLLLRLPDGNNVVFYHGISKDITKVVKERGLCVVQGHFHTEFRVAYVGTPMRLLWGMAVGCSIDKHALAFAYDKLTLSRPVVGHGIILDGHPQLLPMVLGRGGKWIGKL